MNIYEELEAIEKGELCFMATYHICDQCGRDLKDGSIYYIDIYPEKLTRENQLNPDPEKTELINFKKKEVCDLCAKKRAHLLNWIDEHKDQPDWTITLESPKYELTDGSIVYCEDDGRF